MSIHSCGKDQIALSLSFTRSVSLKFDKFSLGSFRFDFVLAECGAHNNILYLQTFCSSHSGAWYLQLFAIQ